MTDKNGWIKIHRDILENAIFNCEPYSKGQAWMTILLLANHKKGYITVKNGEMIEIERGDCGYSELALADIFKWSRGKVKRFLKLLENEKMIQQKKRSDRSIISILNYEKYQNDTTNDTTNSTTNEHQTIQQTDINKNDKNDKNDKKYIYGEFQNVRLTEEEYNKLSVIYGNKFNDAIEKLSSYLASKGKKYKSHYAVLGQHNWVYKSVVGEKTKSDDDIIKEYLGVK